MKLFIRNLNLNLFLLLIVMAGLVAGCDDKEAALKTEIPENPPAEEQPAEKPPAEKPPVEEPSIVKVHRLARTSVLAGSEWELVALGNETTGETTAVTPVPGDLCYRISFKTDSSYLANGSDQAVHGYYRADTSRMETGFYYSGAFCTPLGGAGFPLFPDLEREGIYPFHLSEGELKFVCADGVSLLFRPAPEPAAPASLPGSRWKLSGFVDVETGEVTVPQPEINAHPASCVLWFRTDGNFSGRSSTNSMWGRYIVDASAGTVDIQGGTSTYIGEYSPDGYWFLDGLERGIHPYELLENELRIFGDQKFYLQFKTY